MDNPLGLTLKVSGYSQEKNQNSLKTFPRFLHWLCISGNGSF